MEKTQLRNIPRSGDAEQIRTILQTSGFFNAEEVEVGVSLVDERLEKGEACGYFFVIAESAERITGYTCYGPIPGTADSYDLYWIAVDPLLQNKGLGTVLLKATEEAIVGAGGRRVYIETSSTTLYHGTRSFYEKNAYFLETQQEHYYGPGDSKLLYVKDLVSPKVPADPGFCIYQHTSRIVDRDGVVSLLLEQMTFIGYEKTLEEANQVLENAMKAESRSVLFVSYDSAKAVAFAFGNICSGLESGGDYLYLNELYVCPEYRKQGLGTQLLRSVQSWAKEKGCTYLALVTHPRNEQAKQLYIEESFDLEELVWVDKYL